MRRLTLHAGFGMAMKAIVGIAVAVPALILIVGGQIALAQGSSLSTSIAVIDPQFLLYNSNAAKNARVQGERIRVQYQQDFKGKQDGLDQLYETLAAERATLPPEVYQQRARDLQQRAAVYQREAQERQLKLDSALNGASQKIAAAMTQVVDEIIKENKLTLVLPRSITIGTPGVPDITQDVLTRLNQKMPSVTIDLPK